VKDRTSELKDKVDILKKTEDYLKKSLKSYVRNMQKHCDSIKRPNLQIIVVEKGEV
jgi:hypothetical protein